tara:strand:+ start:8484 stop:9755 length:1272 start_codon:yes stop_codon:yes gene_type:complete
MSDNMYLNILKQKYKGKRIKSPKGGLTAAGRKYFKRKEGANLKPGVKGKANTPEKKRRKGSFLTRFYTNPRGPMKDKKGRPTRLALAARAWGEAAPSTRQQAQKLAAKGRRMLDRYQASKKTKKALFKEGGGAGGGGGAATSGGFGSGGGTVFTSTNSGIFTPTYGGGGYKRRKNHIREIKRKKDKRSGIERLSRFLREYTPEKKSINATKELTELIKSVTKSQYPAGRGYGGNLGMKVLDWKKPNTDEEPPKVSEFKGKKQDEDNNDAVIEQNYMEQKIKNLKDESRKEGRDQATEDEVVSAANPGLVTLKSYSSGATSSLSPTMRETNPYKRSGDKDKVDDNPEIAKDKLTDLIDKFLDIEKYSGYSAATTQTTLPEREILEDKKQEIQVLDDDDVEDQEVQPPKGQKKTYSTGDGGGYSM